MYKNAEDVNSARTGYPWLRRSSRISSPVWSGFMSKSGRHRVTPPRLGRTCGVGLDGSKRGSATTNSDFRQAVFQRPPAAPSVDTWLPRPPGTRPPAP